MSARADILAGTNNTAAAALTARRAAGDGAMADLFVNFVGYASTNWTYAAQPGAQTAADLLAGDGPKTVACATLREALRTLVAEELGLEVSRTDINSYFLTKPGLQCFDLRVKGNVGNFRSTTYTLACHFSTHYFIKVADRYYDPCLTAVYTTDKGPVLHETRPINNLGGTLMMRKAGAGRALILLRLLRGATVPGFGSVWEILTPADCKTALSAIELTALKKDPDVLAAKLF